MTLNLTIRAIDAPSTSSDRRNRDASAEIEARKSADAVILAEQGRWYTAIIRPLLVRVRPAPPCRGDSRVSLCAH
jgi:hypothetical protein